MTRAEDLFQALNGLRQAVAHEASGEEREPALRKVKALFELAGFDGEETGEEGVESSLSLAEAIATVQTQAEGELSGSAFALASKTLQDLAALSRVPEPESKLGLSEPVEASALQPASPAPSEPAGPSFAELSAASKARVDEVAANLGIHQHAWPVHHETHHETHDSHEPVEKPLDVKEDAVAEIVEPQSAREVAEATHDFGTPALATGRVPEYAAPHSAESHENADLPVPRLQSPAPDQAVDEQKSASPVIVTKAEPRTPPSAEAAKVATAQRIDTASGEQHQEKTFFSLWLEMLFGRKK